MKKLMIALGVVATAVAVNAASCEWSIGKQAFLMSDGSTKPNGTTVYLVDTGWNGESYSTAFTALTTLLADGGTEANLATVMASKTFTDVLVDTATTYANASQTKVNQNYGQVTTKGDPNGATVANDATEYYFAIFVADGEKYLISDKARGVSYTSSPDDGAAAGFAKANFTDTASISGGWQTYTASAVPEPTSGLLLLLGVAGLALKRKRGQGKCSNVQNA